MINRLIFEKIVCSLKQVVAKKIIDFIIVCKRITVFDYIYGFNLYFYLFVDHIDIT